MNLIKIYITEATYVSGYIIRFKFSDGTMQQVDFERWIKTNVGGCAKYLNKSLFKKFKIIDGKDISWSDDEMCFPFYFLYKEHLEENSAVRRLKMKQQSFSKLKKQIESLFEPSLNMEFCRYDYPLPSASGKMDIPRFVVKLDGKIIWDCPKNLDKEHFDVYTFTARSNNILALLKEYIDSPFEGLLERKFENDKYTFIAQYIGSNFQETKEYQYHLVDLFKAADRRVERNTLCNWAVPLNNYPATLILIGRLKDKLSFQENALLGGLLLKHQGPVTLEEMRVQTLFINYRKEGETKEMFLQWYREGKFDFIYKKRDEAKYAEFQKERRRNKNVRKHRLDE